MLNQQNIRTWIFSERKEMRLPFRCGLNFSKSFLPKAAGQKGTDSEQRTDEIKAEGFCVFLIHWSTRPTEPSRDLVENATIQGYMKAESIPGFRQPMFFMLRASEYCSTEDNHKGERHWRITLLMWAWEEREPLSYRNAVEGTFGFVKLWKMDPKYR